MTHFNQTHGLSKTPTYATWVHIKSRCYDRGNKKYKSYGSRGIYVCERWLYSFEDFLKDMGEKPSGYSIERIDNNGPYSPNNCKWITMKEQAANKRNNLLCIYQGQEKNLREWSRILDMPYRTLWARIKKCGWTVDKAFETKVMTTSQSGKCVYQKIQKGIGEKGFRLRG